MMRVGPGGSQVATPWGFELPSVTTIIGETIPKPFSAGAWYGYKMALEATSELYKVSHNRTVFGETESLQRVLTERGKNPNQSLDVSRGRGEAAHTVLEMLALGQVEAAKKACLEEERIHGTRYGYAVLAWWESHGTEGGGWLPEQPVFSLKHGYAGTADLIGKKSAEVVDLKTHKPAAGFTKAGSGPAYLSDLIQLRAYRLAWESMGKVAPQANRIIIARENGKFLEDNREVPEALWLRCLELYKTLKEVNI